MGAVNLLGGLALDSTLAALKDLVSGMRTASGKALAVGNARSKFTDHFGYQDGTYPDPDVWNVLNELPDDGTGKGHLVLRGGDSYGASYLRISMSPFEDNSSVWISSKDKFQMPMRVGWAVSNSQRMIGQEFFFGEAEADDTDGALGLKRMVSQTPTDIPIQAALSTVGGGNTTLTLSMPLGHPFKLGDRVIVVGCADTRLNIGPVYITGASPLDITLPISLTNGNYSSVGGAIRAADPGARGRNVFGLLLENANVQQATMVSRRNGGKYRQRNTTVATTSASSQGNWSDGILASAMQEQFLNMDECSFRSFSIDGNSNMTGVDKFNQGLPDESLDYRLVARARNLDYMSRPVARIVNIAKTGSSTATVTTDRPHGLTTTSRVGIWGVRDLTAFPNTADQAVASVPTATTFTVVIGSSTTTSVTTGGVVYLNNGLVLTPGALGYSVQTIARANNVLVVTLNAAASGFVLGEYIHLWGMAGAGAAPYENAYRVLRMNGSTIELDAPGDAFGAITTGGAVIRRTEYRVHLVRVLDHTRHYVEILGGRGNTSDQNNAVPVMVTGSTTLSANVYLRTKVRDTWFATSTTLGANGAWSLGTVDQGTDVSAYDSKLRVMVGHLAGIVPGSVIVESSTDNTNWRETHRVPIPSDGLLHTLDFDMPALRYFRYRFQNGTVAQTSFMIGHSSFRGEPSQGWYKNLTGFHLAPIAGQAIPASTSLLGPTLDLGGNHSWDVVRLMWRTDVAGVSMVVEQSFDGVTWYWINGIVDVGIGSGQIESKINARYVRGRATTGTTASTLTVASMALVGR